MSKWSLHHWWVKYKYIYIYLCMKPFSWDSITRIIPDFINYSISTFLFLKSSFFVHFLCSFEICFLFPGQLSIARLLFTSLLFKLFTQKNLWSRKPNGWLFLNFVIVRDEIFWLPFSLYSKPFTSIVNRLNAWDPSIVKYQIQNEKKTLKDP